ncbi:MAG TPA: FGGY-family carbohydrate kinase [Acetivibrio clariflavus]|nr:FGGY-family carbohydrate kinase [Acetivibrio clariflavus]
MEKIRQFISEGNAILGIEFGSTRIKAVLLGENNEPIAVGSHVWENEYVDKIWTYSIESIWTGLQDCYRKLADNVKDSYGVELTKLAAIGISAMMHGYMPFDEKGELLVPFRTWRNTMTEEACSKLTELFNFNIPQRWSIAHLYQAILNKEEHVGRINFITTLAGYVHWKLTGEKVLGICDASGMFPIDISTKDYNKQMLKQFDELIAEKNYPWKISEILPKVLVAGEEAGTLTEAGAKLLDTSGKLQAGIPLCPPEGDAGTGMVATNSVAKRTGNISAGTSIFAMIVLEKELEKVHTEIDIVTTPVGDQVAMVHCNNCTSDINAWVNIFKEFAEAIGVKVETDTLYKTLFMKALEGDADCGGLLSYNYFSGEHLTGFEEGRPLFVRTPESKFNLANFMRLHISSSLASLKLGLDILLNEEKVKVDEIFAHGGLFMTKDVAQSILAGAINVPVSVMSTVGEGGAWGIALLAAYMKKRDEEQTLDNYLSEKVFQRESVSKTEPNSKDREGFEAFMKRYSKGLAIERAAVEYLD